MQIVSFLNMKGGVGKTTLAVNIAYSLALHHKRKVLLVDADPQFNATQYLIEDDVYLSHFEKELPTIREIFVPQRQAAIKTKSGISGILDKSKMSISSCTLEIFDKTRYKGGKLDLIPSTLQLIEVEGSQRGTEKRLAKFLKEKASGYDYVFIDCPPTISVLTQAAMLATDKYLVPIRPDPLSVIGFPLLERWLEDFADDNGLKIERIGLVFTMVRNVNRMKVIMADLRLHHKKEVFSDFLSLSTDVAESVEAHMPIFEFKKRAKTSKQIISITEEFLRKTR